MTWWEMNPTTDFFQATVSVAEWGNRYKFLSRHGAQWVRLPIGDSFVVVGCGAVSDRFLQSVADAASMLDLLTTHWFSIEPRAANHRQVSFSREWRADRKPRADRNERVTFTDSIHRLHHFVEAVGGTVEALDNGMFRSTLPPEASDEVVKIVLRSRPQQPGPNRR